MVPVYDPGSDSGRMLAVDLDQGGVNREDDTNPVAEAERQAAGLGQLLERLGGRYIADAGPSGPGYGPARRLTPRSQSRQRWAASDASKPLGAI
jgi:hypothetical protein